MGGLCRQSKGSHHSHIHRTFKLHLGDLGSFLAPGWMNLVSFLLSVRRFLRETAQAKSMDLEGFARSEKYWNAESIRRKVLSATNDWKKGMAVSNTETEKKK